MTLTLWFRSVDPSLYLHRFAARLQLGKKLAKVADTALQLVKSMKRDWLQTGRRPAGICGAALYIACQVHGMHLHTTPLPSLAGLFATNLYPAFPQPILLRGNQPPLRIMRNPNQPCCRLSVKICFRFEDVWPVSSCHVCCLASACHSTASKLWQHSLLPKQGARGQTFTNLFDRCRAP